MFTPITDIEKTTFKKKLLQKSIELIERRIAEAFNAMENAQAASNSEEKSSAGDKYETSRAMSHLEKDMHSRQLAANKIELAALYNINCSNLYESVAAGSFMRCDTCSFFIAAGLGKINIDGEDIFLLSPNAPLAKLLIGKKIGDLISFNKKEQAIIEIF